MSHPNQSYSNTGDYSNSHQYSFQPSPRGQHKFTGLPALSSTTDVNLGIAHPRDLAYHSPIDGSMNYYGTSNPGSYAHHYQQGHEQSSVYHQPGTISDPYLHTQTTRQIVNPEWTQGHHSSIEFNSSSWPPQHTSHLATPMPHPHGSVSMTQIQHVTDNRSQVPLPQRPYVPHHRQNYFDHFIPENPITFLRHSGVDGITLKEALAENFDSLIGRDDPMFANYPGPAISLRLEWPGYKSWTKQIKTKDWRREPQPITKAKLAIEVAKKVQNFIQDNVGEVITPGAEMWRVGPVSIGVTDLVLVRLVHVSKGSWQAEFRVLE